MDREPSQLAQREILNLGCGLKYLSEAVNVDITPDTGPDVVHDLNVRPWPFPNERFREVLCYDVIEHLDNVVAVMEEVHRVSQPNALLRVTVPHFSSANAFTDPTHRHYFGLFSFDYFTGEHEHSYYTRARFRRRHRQIIFTPTLVNKWVWRMANRWSVYYEQRWAWVFPAWFLYFELEIAK